MTQAGGVHSSNRGVRIRGSVGFLALSGHGFRPWGRTTERFAGWDEGVVSVPFCGMKEGLRRTLKGMSKGLALDT